jgi:hypothetical protein
MALFDFLFDNPRREKGEELYGKLLRDIPSTPEEVSQRFGISSDVSGVYNPLKRNLATGLSRARGAAAARGGRSATPENLFAPIEGSFAESLGSLESEEGKSKIGREDFIARLLDEFLGKRATATKDYLATQPGSSLFDDILGLASTGAQIAGGLGFQPFAKPRTATTDIGDTSGMQDYYRRGYPER